MVLDLARVVKTAAWGFRPTDLMPFSKFPQLLVSPSRVAEMCESQEPEVGTELRFKLRGLRLCIIVALLTAHIDKERLISTLAWEG
jgi:hypothetical protein